MNDLNSQPVLWCRRQLLGAKTLQFRVVSSNDRSSSTGVNTHTSRVVRFILTLVLMCHRPVVQNPITHSRGLNIIRSMSFVDITSVYISVRY